MHTQIIQSAPCTCTYAAAWAFCWKYKLYMTHFIIMSHQSREAWSINRDTQISTLGMSQLYVFHAHMHTCTHRSYNQHPVHSTYAAAWAFCWKYKLYMTHFICLVAGMWYICFFTSPTIHYNAAKQIYIEDIINYILIIMHSNCISSNVLTDTPHHVHSLWCTLIVQKQYYAIVKFSVETFHFQFRDLKCGEYILSRHLFARELT